MHDVKKTFGPKEVSSGKVTDKTFAWYRNKQPEITCTILCTFFLQSSSR